MVLRLFDCYSLYNHIKLMNSLFAQKKRELCICYQKDTIEGIKVVTFSNHEEKAIYIIHTDKPTVVCDNKGASESDDDAR